MSADTKNHSPARWPLVGLLLICGGISLTLSVTHALEKTGEKPDDHAVLVAWLVGLAPVIAAAFLAHLVTDPYTAKWLKLAVGVVFVGAMVLSVDAQSEMVAPIVGDDLSALFPLVLDLSTVVALLALAGVGQARTEAARTETVEPVRATPAEPVRTDEPIRTEVIRTVPETRTDAAPRTEIGRTTLAPRTEITPPPPVRAAVEPSPASRAALPGRGAETVTEKPTTGNAAQAPVPPSREPVDRDALVVELASDIMVQGATWKPDYEALMARTGYKQSWCEKVVRDARRAASAPIGQG